MKPRHLARRVALQSLFEIDVAGHAPGVVLAARIDDQDPPLPAESVEFASKLVHGVVVYQARLDDVIARFAPEWPVDQIAVIDRNVLRIALWEIGIDRTPVKVAINEAVELAKMFGSDASSRFVNGVLGAATRSEFDLQRLLSQLGDEGVAHVQHRSG